MAQLPANLEYVSSFKTSGRKDFVGSVERNATGGVLEICEAASRPYVMRFVRDDSGEHEHLAEMRRHMTAPIPDCLADGQTLGSLRLCPDRSQTEVEERQTSKAPERNPR
jgi:hypothetical protein